MKNISDNNSAVTLGIFAHANAGKTTLTEHLLYHTKVINILGRVDEGNTTTDSMKIEQERGISVRASLVTFQINDKRIQLIDTPGHIDFSAEVERALNVLDCAVVVISGVEGVESQTYTLWKLLKQNKIPTIIFINKMDRVGADYNRTVQDIKKKIEENIIPLINIVKSNTDFVIEKYSYEQITENLAELDDVFLEKFLEYPDQISQETVDVRLEELIKTGKIFPIIGGSALKDEGIEMLLECIEKYLPTPILNIEDKFSAFIYLVRIDNGKKKFFSKILSGKLQERDTIKMEDDSIQKVKGLYTIKGTSLVAIDNAKCGDIVIINGLDAKCDQYIGNKPENANHIHFVNPLITMNVVAKNKSQSSEMVSALNILNEEDPYLNVKYDKLTGQHHISLMGEIQAQVIETMFRERFNIDSELIDPILIYKETPTKAGTGISSYTKVSAIEIEIKPLPLGSGIIYKSKLSTDFLLKKYQKQTERLIKKFINQGLFGWEVTDAEISLIDGRFDSMGSDPMHYNIAVPLALMRALKNCNMKILEPIVKYTINIPKNYLTSVIKTLSSLNGTFEITEDDSKEVTIIGESRYGIMLNFSNILMSITGGRGIYSSYLNKYEVSNNQNITSNYIGPDPRNETLFVINEMGGSLDALDKPFTKRKKESSAKFKRQQKEKLYSKKGNH